MSFLPPPLAPVFPHRRRVAAGGRHQRRLFPPIADSNRVEHDVAPTAPPPVHRHAHGGLPCPDSHRHTFCFNGGECIAQYSPHATAADDAGGRLANTVRGVFGGPRAPSGRFTPFCRCAAGFHGRRCERLFDAELYDFPAGLPPFDAPAWGPDAPPAPAADLDGARTNRVVDVTPEFLAQKVQSNWHVLVLVPGLALLLLLWLCVVCCRRRVHRRRGRRVGDGQPAAPIAVISVESEPPPRF
ncbi:hypothetical protein M3Y99_01056500 [Aphelenchoides fujianensis]|nr:hypothetical protein M3Y99_01056500 [Aphelenchoides fujianensis]